MVTAEMLADRWGLLIVQARARLEGYDPCDWEDVAATALMRAWCNRHTFRPRADGSGLNEWLGGIVARCAVDHWRRERYRRHAPITKRTIGQATTDAGNERHATLLDVRAVLSVVPAETQPYLQLRMDGWTRLEAVRALGLTDGRTYGGEKSVAYRRERRAADQLAQAMGVDR